MFGKILGPSLAVAALAALATLGGCAVYPPTPEGQAEYHLMRAASALAADNCRGVVDNVRQMTANPVGMARAKTFLIEKPQARDCHNSELNAETVAAMSAPAEAIALHARLGVAGEAGALTEAQHQGMVDSLRRRVEQANQSGALPFTLADHGELVFAELATPAQQRLMADRSLALMQNKDGSPRAMAELMTYVQKTGGVGGAEGRRIGALLPALYVRAPELGEVAALYPKFAAARKQAITMKLKLEFKNTSRYMADRIIADLGKRLRGIEWTEAAAPGVAVLSIEQLQHAERELPTRVDAVTREWSEPYTRYYKDKKGREHTTTEYRNRSYSFNRYIGGREIEYAYTVNLRAGGGLHADTLRGVSNSYSNYCDSLYGRDAQYRESSTCSVAAGLSFDDLRDDVTVRLGDRIDDFPALKAIVDMN